MAHLSIRDSKTQDIIARQLLTAYKAMELDSPGEVSMEATFATGQWTSRYKYGLKAYRELHSPNNQALP